MLRHAREKRELPVLYYYYSAALEGNFPLGVRDRSPAFIPGGMWFFFQSSMLFPKPCLRSGAGTECP